MPAVRTGTSFTLVTVTSALASPLLYAVVPPLDVVFAVAPAVPLVRSQALKDSPPDTVPLKFALGTKRTRVSASAFNRVATAMEGVVKAFQLVPPFREYSQAPLVVASPVIAIPFSAPASGSVTFPAIIDDTNVPGLDKGSSSTPASAFAPLKTGAVLVAGAMVKLTTMPSLPPARAGCTLPAVASPFVLVVPTNTAFQPDRAIAPEELAAPKKVPYTRSALPPPPGLRTTRKVAPSPPELVFTELYASPVTGKSEVSVRPTITARPSESMAIPLGKSPLSGPVPLLPPTNDEYKSEAAPLRAVS